MNRISKKIDLLKNQGQKAFIPFLTAGYPNIENTPELVWALESGGVSIVELGMPFSDPLADGPTIQTSSHQAIENGVTPNVVFDYIKNIRVKSEIPLIVFTYTNIVMHIGIESFMRKLSAHGGDGLLIPDLPLEEADQFVKSAHRENLRMVFLVSPLTSEKRMKRIEKLSDDFVYCVSVAGVTGARTQLFSQIGNYLKNVRKTIKKPVMVGFGVSNSEDARKISKFSDGVVVGSALINLLRQNAGCDNLAERVRDFAKDISTSISEK